MLRWTLPIQKKIMFLKIGEGEDWLEILGCGMVNPKVLENCNIDSHEYIKVLPLVWV